MSACWLGGCYAQLTPLILAKPELVRCLVQLAIFALKETLKHLHFATVGEHGCAPRVARSGECTAVLHLPRFTHDHSTVLHLANAASSRSPLSPQLSSLLPCLTPLQSLPINVTVRHHNVKLQVQRVLYIQILWSWALTTARFMAAQNRP